jgi:hypothetical protein
MKEFNTQELISWSKGESEDKVHFVLLKTPNCTKCQKLLNEIDHVFGDLVDFTAIFVYNVTDKEAANFISTLDVTSVPVVICRYKELDGKVGFETIIPDADDDFVNLQCILDALNGDQGSYFGYNQYDEPIEETPQHGFNRIRHQLNGEVDPEVLRERSLLKREVK